MGSLGNNPSTSSWPPYQSYRDCSQGICSIYCPQWCYIMFPPPPPFHDPYPDSGTNFSPLIIAVIGILASAFLLVSYYTIVSKYCSRRPNNSQLTSTTPDLDSNQAQPINNHDQRLQLATSGLDETVIKSIAICKYRKGDGFVDGTDCAVCLSEFQEHENLRLLPKCRHAFHPPCIDTWLRSHSNCPLCRSNVSPIPILTVPPETQPPTLVNISSLEFQRGSDSVLVVEEREGVASGEREEIAVSFAEHPFSQSQFQFKSGDQASVGGNGEVGVGEFPRSSSMGSFALGNSLSIADILSIDEDLQAKHGRIGIGSSSSREFESRTNMRRSISTGRFFTTSDHRGNSALILPN